MRWILLVTVLASGCAHERPKYKIAYRPSRPPHCALEFYGPTRSVPEQLVPLGSFPLQVTLEAAPQAVETAVAPVACKAGATAVLIREPGPARPIGGRMFIRELEIVLLAPPKPAEETDGPAGPTVTDQ